jgi:mannose-6-phosphate isomerase-like protein (cupin superfamily)
MNERPCTSGDVDNLWFLNSWLIVRRSAMAGPDGVSIIEHHDPCGDSPPTHVHHREDEIFHILEGSLRLKLGERELVARAGETVVAPKGVPHSFRVESTAGARYLTIVTGSGFESLVRSVSRPATARALPRPVAATPDMIAELARAAALSGIEIVGPPMN